MQTLGPVSGEKDVPISSALMAFPMQRKILTKTRILSSLTISAGTITSGVYAPGTISATQDVPGATFSFSQAYTQADAVPTGAVTVGETANFGNVVSTAGGTVGNLAGTTSSPHAFSNVAAGGANTSATTQFVTEVTVR